MSALSDQLVTYAILAYLVAMISHAVEYALGNARAVSTKAAAPARELVGAGVGGAGGTAGEPVAVPVETRPGRSGARAALAGRIAAWVTVVAAALHLGAVVTRGIAAERMPWGNMYEFVLTVTFIGVAAWLAVLWRQPQLRRLGLFLTLVMVLLLAFAELKLYVQVTPLMPALKSYWFVIHVSTIIFASGIFLLGVVPAASYLMRSGWEQGKRSFPYTLARRLPAAAGLERLTFMLHAFAFPIFTFAVIAGAIWAEAAWGRAWGWDPKETWAFISWVVYAGYLHARATPSIKRNVATWISILGFLTMLMNLFGVNFFFTGLHSYAGVN
ncbi:MULTISPECIES: c-type cytochrome biogenesis protein CcsB [Micromonospora]|uniref:C-type cytochrome biogenesis protein CcsB n=1 Tax=Micromonospora solifontis TaxID=2487138 RepID=A0ABX9WFG4_9ACTN|nr:MULTISPECIES: c-type cytochrome biogenesis protein CcsB [Micromonospora]NES15812.1 c-type cytochrome biogenesis protein CcsB [Micromonospora sp. PPF5-17B]NES38079.1 c-type cytochrome biogenesis protein CcsB [Micromonospora solifontis]NES56658.1 c-type cytochrome biogenesis protein CcsB [Micromonospora sp. PPF5-6]RNL97084.1 c-type cytochrome biogenesis protein CcsB [Micromonospora solifontis]